MTTEKSAEFNVRFVTKKGADGQMNRTRVPSAPMPPGDTAEPSRRTSSATATFSIFRGSGGQGKLEDYTTEIEEGMVVLDAVHAIQAKQAPDMACRWNCKAGKCGSCSAEINGHPKLMCMTRLNTLPLDKPVTIEPIRAFPHMRDLVTDVSWNFEVKKKIKAFKPRASRTRRTARGGCSSGHRSRPEFRKCIECFSAGRVSRCCRSITSTMSSSVPRFLVYSAALEAPARLPKIAAG
jgi:succinate dehydrogenase / fumarate reductase iron-sulfur subunit